MKAKCNSWESTNEAAYVDPRLQRNPALLANVDVALDMTEDAAGDDLPSPLHCYNCSVRPTNAVHPSLVERQRQQSSAETAAPPSAS